MKIHVFGDSHTKVFESFPNTVIHKLVDYTMYIIGRDQLDAIDFESIETSPDDILIFVFGEIDVRFHIVKQRDIKKRDLNEIIKTLVIRYIESILLYRTKLKKPCIIYSVTPQAVTEPLVSVGSLEDRVQITNLLNAELKSQCIQFHIPYLDVYDDYKDDKGVLRYNVTTDNNHIDEPDALTPIYTKLSNILKALR